MRTARTDRLVEGDIGFFAGLRTSIREIFAYREVLTNLVRKELKVRYKNSILGFAWSTLNPLLYLVVFYIVFNYFLRSAIPKFHIYLLAGLLPWTLFSSGLFQATGSIVGNAELVKKVYFPREVLPLSGIGAALVHFFLQLIVLAVFLAASRYPVAGEAAILLPAALATELLVIAGFGFFFAALNVKARDIQHMIELGLLAWFWMTPIVYPSALVGEQMAGRSVGGVSLWGVYLLNPMTRIVLAFQRGIYAIPSPMVDGSPMPILVDASVGWYLKGLGYTAAAAIVLLAVGWWVFHRVDPSFAEEL